MTGEGRSAEHKRPWLAAVLSLIYPGLGHVYLREWLRALLWFGLAIAVAAVAVPTGALPASNGEFSFDAVLQASQAIPQGASLVILGVIVCSVLDSYRLAAIGNRQADADVGDRCPACGHELDDPELDFCPWCTTPLDSDAEPDRNAPE